MTATYASPAPPFSYTGAGEALNSGEDLLARYHHVVNEDSDWTLQTYFDNAARETILNSSNVNTFDVDFQSRISAGQSGRRSLGEGVIATSRTTARTRTFSPRRSSRRR